MDLTEIVSEGGAFRAIETNENRSLDAIAVAAVTAFTTLHRPARQDRAQIDLLIRPNLHRLGKGALQKISVQLSSSPHAPVQLLHAMAMLPVGISAPLILRSPLLTDDFLDYLVEETGDEHRQVVLARAGRREPADLAAAALREKLSELQQAETRAPLPGLTWDEIIEAVCVDHDVAAASSENSDTNALVALALSANPAFLQTRIADLTGLPFALVASAMREPDSGEATTLLKAAGLDTATGLALILIAARIDLGDVERVRMLHARYRGLGRDDAWQTVAGWKRDYEHAAPAANDGEHPDAVTRVSVA